MIKTTIRIEGMSCPMCESHINDAIRNGFAVKKVTSSHKKNLTEVISEEALDVSVLKAAIEAGGYRVEDVTSEPYEEKRKKFWIFG